MEDGTVLSLQNQLVESRGPLCAIAEQLEVGGVVAEVVGFGKKRVISRLLGDPHGIRPGTPVKATGKPLSVAVGPALKGRVLDGLGRPLDGAPFDSVEERPLHVAAAPFLQRGRIDRVLATGLRVVDSLLTLGAGQSFALQSDTGVGKTTLLGLLTRNTRAHSVVLANIGERQPSIRDILERDLLPEGLARSVVVAASADASPGERVKAAYTAMAVAEYLRDQGQDVLLMVDSVPRWWAAHREMGLPENGLEQLLARAGVRAKGTITILLVTDLAPENDLRGLTEGHCVLCRRIAHTGRYPAIDVSQSVSRRFTEITTRQHQQSAGWLRSLLVNYQEHEALIESGAYQSGINRRVDEAIARMPDCRAFLMQGVFEPAEFQDTLERLDRLKAT